jgi:hypothetical protein
MQARGVGGSGNELLAQLQSSQAATDRQAQQGLDVAGMAQSRALQSNQQQGALGGDIRRQDFGEQSAKAQATDNINQFNVGTRNDFTKMNATNSFAADTRNVNTKQDLNNTTAANANTQQMHNNYTVPQQSFNNQATKQGVKNDALTAHAGFKEKALAAKQAERAGDQKMFTDLAASGAAAYGSDKTLKKDVRAVKDVDIEEFLSSFSPKKFKYKKEEMGKGDYTGVMAQDLQKSKLGQDILVENEEGKLGIDSQKMQGVQLAAIKFLADKLKETK